MIPSWLAIGIVTLAVPLFINRFISNKDFRWFKRLRRPEWLTFEGAIPLIWTIIFICGAWSAHNVWQANPHTLSTWLLIIFYLIVEVAISWLLVPYLLWSPVGTFVTWQMIQLNPLDA